MHLKKNSWLFVSIKPVLFVMSSIYAYWIKSYLLQRSAEGSSAEDGEGKNTVSLICIKYLLGILFIFYFCNTIQKFCCHFQIQIKMREAIAPL